MWRTDGNLLQQVRASAWREAPAAGRDEDVGDVGGLVEERPPPSPVCINRADAGTQEATWTTSWSRRRA